MGPLTYWLTLPDHWKVNPVFHQSKLHPVTPDQVAERVNGMPKVFLTEEGHKIVNKVLDAQWRQGKYKLKCCFFGFGPEQDKWVKYDPEEHGPDLPDDEHNTTPLQYYLQGHPIPHNQLNPKLPLTDEVQLNSP